VRQLSGNRASLIHHVKANDRQPVTRAPDRIRQRRDRDQGGVCRRCSHHGWWIAKAGGGRWVWVSENHTCAPAGRQSRGSSAVQVCGEAKLGDRRNPLSCRGATAMSGGPQPEVFLARQTAPRMSSLGFARNRDRPKRISECVKPVIEARQGPYGLPRHRIPGSYSH